VLKAGNKEGLVHCFSGSEEDAKNFLSIGFYVSFAGNITYKKGKELIEIEKIIRMIPDDKLLIETDSPYLSPYPRRGEVNFPKNITFTLEKISEIRKINYFLLSKKMTQNSLNLFNIKTKI
jgi:TatD DNase family protein